MIRDVLDKVFVVLARCCDDPAGARDLLRRI